MEKYVTEFEENLYLKYFLSAATDFEGRPVVGYNFFFFY